MRWLTTINRDFVHGMEAIYNWKYYKKCNCHFQYFQGQKPQIFQVAPGVMGELVGSVCISPPQRVLSL